MKSRDAMQLPKITIVTPSYQQAVFLERTIQSVLSQNYPNLEYMVLDGGSRDNSVEIIKKYAPKLAFWISEKDSGQSAAINRGLRMASGEIVGWLNSDDTLAPGALHRIGRYYSSHPDVDLVYGHTWTIDANDRILRRLVAIPTNSYELIHLNRNIFSQPGTTWRRRVHDKAGYLDESLQFLMDNDWWIRVSKVARMHCLPFHLANLRIHAATKSNVGLQENEDIQRLLDTRYGAAIRDRAGWPQTMFRLRRLGRIFRDPRNWFYLTGLSG